MGTTIQIGHLVRLRSDGLAYEILDIDLDTRHITARRRGVKGCVAVPFADIHEIVPKTCVRRLENERMCAEG